MVRVPQELVLFKLLYKYLKSKDRCSLIKSFNAKRDRVVANGPYSKGMDVQTHTPSVSIKHTLYVLAQFGRAGVDEIPRAQVQILQT